MKLLKLRFKNINSLAGFWEIDFENTQFTEGLFALTGPTGAGKSTVLDAVCLGFYGKTARQEISKSKNETMTRGTGDCFAEVEFELRGRRYRSSWEQHRERGKANGALQSPTRKISTLPEGQIISEKLKECDDKILELLGMDFCQFTRSVLLAQGQFDAFLKAHERERSAILEQVTGTEIYSKIGSSVFSRWQIERDRKSALEQEIQSSSQLPDELRMEIEANIGALEEQRLSLSSMIATLQKQIEWHEKLRKLREDHDVQLKSKAEIVAELENSKDEFACLDKALEARKLDALLQKIETARKSKEDAAKKLLERKSNLEKIEIEIAGLKPQIETSTQKMQDCKAKLDKTLPLVEEARRRDSEIKGTVAELKAADLAAADAQKAFKEADILRQKTWQTLETAEDDCKKAENYLSSNSGDANLKGIVPRIESYLSIWEARKKDFAKKDRDCKNSEKSLAEKEEFAKDTHAELEKASRLHSANLVKKEKAEKTKDDAENGHMSAKPDLEVKIRLAHEKQLLAQRIASLEDQRKLLEDGKPCPLCGSCRHPYAEGKIPEISSAQEELNAFQTELKKLEEAERSARKQWEKAEKDSQKSLAELEAKRELSQNAVKELDSSKNDLQNSRSSLDGIAKEIESLWGTISSDLSSAGITPNSASVAADFFSLKARQSEFEKWQKEFSDAKIRVIAGKEALKDSSEKLQSANCAREGKISAAKAKKDAVENLTAQRKSILEGDPDKIEKRLRADWEDALRHDGEIRMRMEKLGTSAAKEAEELDAAQKSLALRIQEEDSILESSREAFAKAGFADEKHCRDSRMGDNEMSRVASKKEELGKKLAGFSKLIEKLAEDIKAEEALEMASKSAAELAQELIAEKTTLQKCETDLTDAKVKLKTDDDHRSKCASAQANLEAQSKIFDKWNRLNSWIGGANGEQFKRYAQGITLRGLLKTANAYLLKMSCGRYEMICKPDDKELLPLAIDHHQGDIERPISNFSGGETFMVSLSLALGLAQMASGRLRIDSLFLDEGFGTLDNQSLDIAVNTLAELHQSEGKLIGVISHIEQLKSQISARIEIRKIGGGRSAMEGAGVSRIDGTAKSRSDAPKQVRHRSRK